MENKTDLKKEALDFLNGHRKMVLTVLDQNKHPNSSLMLYTVDDDFNVYFGTRKAFGKYKALMADSHVSLAVVEETMDPLRVVDMQGEAELIPGEDTAERLEWFTKKNPAKYYVKDAEDFVMFKITPSGVRWLDATSGDLMVHDLEI